MADNGTVKIIVDDVEYEVPAGILLIDAITDYVGFDMPRFCHHDRLVPVGMCRMCMAEVEARGRWANAATCTLRVADGMKVRVRSEAAVKARRMTLELLLANHPLDCPICDKGGECMLQDQTVAHGPEVARTVELRRHWPKPIPLSSRVLLDRERCIQCARCTRFVDEIAGEPTIELINRGFRAEISPAFDGQYSGHFTGNTCDICPVGALTSTSFRFRSRPWEMQDRPVISPFDAGGANLYLSVRENVVRRALPRENRSVNDLWCSDKERFYYDWILSDERLDVPLVRNQESGQLEPATFEDALTAAAEGLAAAVRAGKPVVGIGPSVLGCEEQYVFQKLLRGVLGSNHVITSRRIDIERRAGLIPTYDRLERAKTFFYAGPSLIGQHPMPWLRIYKALRFRGARLWLVGNEDRFAGLAAELDVRCRPGAETAVIRGLLAHLHAAKQHHTGAIRAHTHGFTEASKAWQGYTLEQAAAEAEADPAQLMSLAERLAEAEDLVVIAPHGVGRADGTALRDALWNLALLLGVPAMDHGGWLEVLDHCNTRGASDMGVRPDLLPGYAPVADAAERERFAAAWGLPVPDAPGLDADGVLAAAEAGELGAMLVVGSDWVSDTGNPFQTVRSLWLNPDDDRYRATLAAEAERRAAALEQVPFVVVSELFCSETAKRADVVLPATCFAERAGTYVNLEGRVQYAPAAVRPILGVRSDLGILNGLGTRLSEAWTPLDSDAAWAELTALVPSYAEAPRDPDSGGHVVPLPPPDGRYRFV